MRALLLALGLQAALAFVPRATRAPTHLVARVRSEHRARVIAEMSDAVEAEAAEPVADAPAPAAPAAPAAPDAVAAPPPSPKEELLGVIGTTGPAGSAVSEDLRSTVIELLMKVEAANPTDAPATSPLLNGVWELVYSGNYAPGPFAVSPTRQLALFLYAGGYTPGLFALNVARQLPGGLVDAGPLTLAINRAQPRIEASSTVTLPGMAEQAVKVRATLEAESAVRLRETHTEFDAFGRTVNLPAALQYTRRMYVSYVDDELLVVKDESGIPDILLRKAKPDFIAPDEGVPSTQDDDLAPGAG